MVVVEVYTLYWCRVLKMTWGTSSFGSLTLQG